MNDLDIMTTGDLELDEYGDLRVTSGFDEIVQQVSRNINDVRGAWEFNVLRGVPLYDDVLVTNPDIASLRTMYAGNIRAAEGVVDVIFLDLSLDKATRTLRLNARFTVDPAFGNNADRIALGLPPLGSTVDLEQEVDLDNGELNLILFTYSGFTR